MAINTVLANLAIFLGPIFGSLVSDAIGIRPAFFVAAPLLLHAAKAATRAIKIHLLIVFSN